CELCFSLSLFQDDKIGSAARQGGPFVCLNPLPQTARPKKPIPYLLKSLARLFLQNHQERYWKQRAPLRLIACPRLATPNVVGFSTNGVCYFALFPSPQN